jgi:hypothetical protein
MTKAELIEKAESLGIEVAARWTVAKIQEEITKAEQHGDASQTAEPTAVVDTPVLTEAPAPKPKRESYSVRNICNSPWDLSRTVLMPGKEYTLTERDLADKMFLAKLQNAINGKFLERC